MPRANTPDVAVIIAAGGTGKRMGGRVPKQFLRAGAHPVLVTTVRAFEAIRSVREIVVVVPRGYAEFTHRLLTRAGCQKIGTVIEGGRERQNSVRAGLDMLSGDPDIVLVHDAVRPFVTGKVIRKVIKESARFGAAVVGVRVKDTIKKEGKRGFYSQTLQRHLLWAVQTPQGFRVPLFKRAHRRALLDGFLGTDDAMLAERLGIPVRIVEGLDANVKITTREDLILARRVLGKRK